MRSRPGRRRRELEDRPRARARGRARCSRSCAGRSARRTTSASRAASTCSTASSARPRARRGSRAAASRRADLAELLVAGVDFPAEEDVELQEAARSARLGTARSSSQRHVRGAARRDRARLGRRGRLRRRHQLRRRRARTAATRASPRSARSPATGAAGTTSASRRSRRPRAARTAAARARASSAPCRRTSGWARRASWPRRSTGAGSPQRRVIELAPRRLRRGRATTPSRPRSSSASPHEVVALVRVSLERLELSDEPVEVLLGGGLMQSNDRRLLDAIERGVHAVAPAASVHVTSSPPIVGAALFALDDLGAGPEAQARLRAELERPPRAPWRRRALADVRYEDATRIYPGTDMAAVDEPQPAHRRRRVHGARRALGLGQDDRPAHARRPRGGGRRRRASSAAATSPTWRPRSATSRWSSRTTRSTPT